MGRVCAGMVALLLLAGATCVHAQNVPFFLVKPYLQNGAHDAMTVLWETDVPASSRVEYGLVLPFDRHAALDGFRTMHEVRITGLEEATSYFYRVVSKTADGTELASPTYTFKTNVPADQPVGVMVVSDTQTNPVIWGKIAELGWRQRPNFVLHAGDLVGTGGNKSHWVNDFLNPGHVLMSRFPVYSVPGNHEDDHAQYYQYMANPGNPEYRYTFTYGNARFFMLDSNHDMKKGSEQYAWLEGQLREAKETWKIVVHHHPVYTSDENDYGDTYKEISALGDDAVQDVKVLYDQYNVDLVFYGHIHDYERTWPIRGGKVDLERGVRYIQIGGAGGGLENYAPTRSWFTAKVHRDHHFGMMMIFGGRLEFQAIDQNGILFDQFVIEK